MRRDSKRSERGGAIVEVALMAPWIFFLFVGVFDLGFYSYAIICTQNAARASAMQTAVDQTSQSDVIACNAAWNEMSGLPNVAGTSANCTKLPVLVTRTTRCGTQVTMIPACTFGTATNPPPSDADSTKTTNPDQAAASSVVSVQYQSGLFVPIPGILTNQLTITRSSEMRIIQE